MKTIVLIFALLVQGYSAPMDDEHTAAYRRAIDLSGAWSNDGFKRRDSCWTGKLKKGEAKIVEVNLYAGDQYWFSVGTDGKAKKMAVTVYDETGKPVEILTHQDDDGGARAAAGFAPAASGPYLIKVQLLEGDAAVFALVYSYK
jgi:hypothetical protein